MRVSLYHQSTIKPAEGQPALKMASFFNFGGQTYRMSVSINWTLVTCPDASKKFYWKHRDFEKDFPGWRYGVAKRTAMCMIFLSEFFAKKSNTPDTESARIERAVQLGAKIVERTAVGGVGSVYVSKTAPGFICARVGAKKNNSNRALYAAFWTDDLIKLIRP